MEAATTFKLVRRSLENKRFQPLWNRENKVRRRFPVSTTTENVLEALDCENSSTRENTTTERILSSNRRSCDLSFESVRGEVTQKLTSTVGSTKRRKRGQEKPGQFLDRETVKLFNDVIAWKEKTKAIWIYYLRQIDVKNQSHYRTDESILCLPDVLAVGKRSVSPAVLAGLNILFETIRRSDVRPNSISPPELDVEHFVVPIGVFVPTSAVGQNPLDIALSESKNRSSSVWRPTVVDGILIPINCNDENQFITRLLLSSDAVAGNPLAPLVLLNTIVSRVEPRWPNILELPPPPHNAVESLELAFTYSEKEVDVLQVVKDAWGVTESPETISVPGFTVPIELVATLAISEEIFQ